jgi:hypothetical protein
MQKIAAVFGGVRGWHWRWQGLRAERKKIVVLMPTLLGDSDLH